LLIKPILPPYDPLEWAKKPFAEKSRMVCCAWAMQGYGTPLAVYLVYVIKIAFYIGGWFFFCKYTAGMGTVDGFTSWAMRPEAFQKAILWSMLFEILGLGCGSGPLTGRYVPPVGGFLYFLRPGTTKLPVFRKLPIIGGHRRTLLDVLLYFALIVITLNELVSDTPDARGFIALAVLLPVIGILDKTLFLCARGEHYWTTIAVFAIAMSSSLGNPPSTGDWLPGAKAIHAALWFWAGVSKLNHHFPSVVGVMTSNSPLTRFEFVRRMMYRKYPEDLAPSQIAVLGGHAGTALELAVPIVLLMGNGGTVTTVGLVLMIMLHGFITSNVPMGVPLEWNVIMVYGGFFLFWKHASVSLLALSASPAIAILIFTMAVMMPFYGNLYPSKIPFLLAMRYYAGNWAMSVWFFKGESYVKLNKLTKSSGWIYDQLGRLYDRAACIAIVGKVMAFRLMHLHGRLLSKLVPKAVGGAERFNDYEWIDGEMVAGIVLGWNFGDGHLHREELLEAVQAQCGFEEGELRCIMVEAQPLFGDTLHYRVVDAKTGVIEDGKAVVSTLRKQQPWGGTTPKST
jgi:hypothetical protein